MKTRHDLRHSPAPARDRTKDSSTLAVGSSDSSTVGAMSSPPQTRVKAAVRVRPLLHMEMASATSASSSPPPTDDGHACGSGDAEMSYPDVIRVITAAGRLTRPIASPYMLEVLQPPAERTGRGRGPQRSFSTTHQSLQHNAANGRGWAAVNYAFDYCAGPSTTQSEFFDMLEMPALCEAALAGEVVTVFCFGQTGSGKTYSLSGQTLPPTVAPGPVSDAPTPLVAEDGLQYQAVHYIARRLKELRRSSRKSKPKRRDSHSVGDDCTDHRDDVNAIGASTAAATVVTAKCSYVELYQESLYDLLQPDGGDGVRCRWSAAAASFFVEGSLMVECRGREDFLLVLREGQRNRQRGSHALNLDSSRSHVVFTIFFEVRDGAALGAPADGAGSRSAAPPSPETGDSPSLSSTRYGRLVFVDLAGSERLKKTQSTSNAETGSINKSLFTLGRVLELLSAPPPSPSAQMPTSVSSDAATSVKAAGQPPPFIPYRSSVLTQLLMHSLDGHGRTVMVACVSPSALHLEESLRTIHYAQRARRIRATPVVHVDAATQHRKALEEKVHELQRENALLRCALGLPRVGTLQDTQVDARLEELHRAWAATQLVAPPHKLPSPSAVVSPRPSSTSRRGPPPQQSGATRACPSRSLALFTTGGATAAADAVAPRAPTPQTVLMPLTESEVGDVLPTVIGGTAPLSNNLQPPTVNILALLDALPDRRLMHT
ncbi:hypothetical protein JKF63_07088 [Porcisia hertigi]|uniref:Kinesin-like protein n=1 Tax=Porcisia hertigi TaxID=2761500 RepID=A0A836LKB7_9TRYP|nr:hypothetical protein JKF63_07088 [Porcisia hertigi]